MNKSNNANKTTLLKPRFSKVSFEEFQRSWNNRFPDGTVEIPEGVLKEIYDNIKLPQRSTNGSAGYDFFCPKSFALNKGESVEILTGIRCEMPDNVGLFLFPRSGHGFKFGVRLANSIGIVDSDFAYTDNEGHIRVKLVNDSVLGDTLRIKTGDAFCQGVFLNYITTEDDAEYEKEIRTGGFGSTDKE